MGAIGPGLVVLLGVGQGDTDADADTLADKVLNLRVFSDEAGQMNRSVLDVVGRAPRRLAVHPARRRAQGAPAVLLGRGAARGGEPAVRALRGAPAAVGPPGGDRRLPRDDGRGPREPGAGHDPPRLTEALLTMATARRSSRAPAAALRLLAAVAGLLLFVLALELLKRGAGGVGPMLRAAGVSGLAGGIGAGWIGACLLLSGSPVAAVALTLLASGTLTTAETFGMISGSRLGASFVVLVVGVLEDLRAGRREARSAYIGVTALVATAVTYLPAMGLSWLALERGALAGLRLEGRDLEGIVERLYGPVLHAASALAAAGGALRGRGRPAAPRVQGLRSRPARPRVRPRAAPARGPRRLPALVHVRGRPRDHRDDPVGLGVDLAPRPARRARLRPARERVALHPRGERHDPRGHALRRGARGPPGLGADGGPADGLGRRSCRCPPSSCFPARSAGRSTAWPRSPRAARGRWPCSWPSCSPSRSRSSPSSEEDAHGRARLPRPVAPG